jgi:hypothetical protein
VTGYEISGSDLVDRAYALVVEWTVIVALIAGCSFEHGVASKLADAPVTGDGTVDTAIDSAVAKFCPTDTHVRLCLSFDQDPLPTSMPNEGAANVSATLTNVMRSERNGGGAAEISVASSIYVPYTIEVAGIHTFEVSFRADVAPPNNLDRTGIVDSNVYPNISLFLYRMDPGYQLRCGLGYALLSFDAPGLQLAMWHRVVCTCNVDTLQLYLDDVKIGETANAGCMNGGAIETGGLTIGSNNNGGPTGVDQWLIGAVDGVRMWDQMPPQ